MTSIRGDLQEDLIADDDEISKVPEELHQMFEDMSFDYSRTKTTTNLLYFSISLVSTIYIFLFVEYILFFNSGKFYFEFSLRFRSIYLIIFSGILMISLILFIFVNITGIYQYYKKYFYCTKSRLNYYGTITILNLLINGIFIISSILAMREVIPSNCRSNQNLCIAQYCNSTENIAFEFAQYYEFNFSDFNSCSTACTTLIHDKCESRTVFSYVNTILSSISFIINLILMKFVCLTK